MTESPPTYSERRRLIADKLEPIFGVSTMAPTNTESAFEPSVFENSLVCSWADPETLTGRTVYVHLNRVPDGGKKALDIREMIAAEAMVTPGEPFEEAEAVELNGQLPDEYVFVLNYLGRLTAITDRCVISITPWPIAVPLGDLAAVALDIARTVGCSAYVDDFVPPAMDEITMRGSWTTADGLVYDPRTPPQA